MLADHEQVRQANVALVRRFVDAINDSWNIEVIRELVADDFFFIIPSRRIGSGSVRKAKRNALRFLDSVRDLMDPENLHDVRIDTCAGDSSDVIAEYKSATRMKATNLAYRNEYIGRFRIRDGKITAFAEYLDPTRFVIAVGGAVVPPATMTSSG